MSGRAGPTGASNFGAVSLVAPKVSIDARLPGELPLVCNRSPAGWPAVAGSTFEVQLGESGWSKIEGWGVLVDLSGGICAGGGSPGLGDCGGGAVESIHAFGGGVCECDRGFVGVDF